ncbi:MAG: ribose 5-phosphate isomerase B [Anaerolineae bacterium]|jgi:ribose 5-phosphate isomerase B|nr:ribose 5-phosphate isomerase B [Anaerolineae bacterium]
MIIAVGCDHGGFSLKQAVLEAITEAGHQFMDLGVDEASRVDYPDYARLVCEAILSGKAERGIAICGSGIGMNIAVNKYKGIYGSVCHDTYSAHQGVEHDNMNVLCLGARVVGDELAKDIVKSYLGTSFFNHGNYLKRVNKVKQIEEEQEG